MYHQWVNIYSDKLDNLNIQKFLNEELGKRVKQLFSLFCILDVGTSFNLNSGSCDLEIIICRLSIMDFLIVKSYSGRNDYIQVNNFHEIYNEIENMLLKKECI